ncbi:MAG: hypothetical protein ACI9S8_001304 [Chlamydiales bacterium]|jgi:hypothetical protein
MSDERDDKELMAVIAKLESKVDLLESEIMHLNDLLIQFGFNGGVESLKRSIKEILRSEDPPFFE